jgi:hypothetical protein
MSSPSYIGNNSVSIGIRNNNPGNLRPGDSWKGMVGTNKNFIVFENVAYGLRALAIDLTNKRKRGLDTITKIISVYAPPSENNTVSYIKAVSDFFDIPADQKISLNQDTLKKFMRAIIIHENGPANAEIITDSDIDEGVSMMPFNLIDYLKTFFAKNPEVSAALGYGILAVIIIAAIIIYSKYYKDKK